MMNDENSGENEICLAGPCEICIGSCTGMILECIKFGDLNGPWKLSHSQIVVD
jgi:hypothetical protein